MFSLKKIVKLDLFITLRKKADGVIRFSKPVEVKQLYARKHNYIYYQEERKSIFSEKTQISKIYRTRRRYK